MSLGGGAVVVSTMDMKRWRDQNKSTYDFLEFFMSVEMMKIMIGHEIFDTSLSFQSGWTAACESSTINVCISSKEVFTSADKCVNIFGRLCLGKLSKTF